MYNRVTNANQKLWFYDKNIMTFYDTCHINCNQQLQYVMKHIQIFKYIIFWYEFGILLSTTVIINMLSVTVLLFINNYTFTVIDTAIYSNIIASVKPLSRNIMLYNFIKDFSNFSSIYFI